MVVLAVLGVFACGAVPVAVISLVVHQYDITCWISDRIGTWQDRRRRETPTGRPIEAIAHDVRRLNNRFEHVPRGMSFARYDATRRAYDDVLVESCHALGIDEHFSALPPGTARDLQRRNAEFLLEQAGLRLRDAA